MKTETALRCF